MYSKLYTSLNLKCQNQVQLQGAQVLVVKMKYIYTLLKSVNNQFQQNVREDQLT